MDRTFTIIQKGKTKRLKGKTPYAVAKKLLSTGVKNISLVDKKNKKTYKYKVIKGKIKSIPQKAIKAKAKKPAKKIKVMKGGMKRGFREALKRDRGNSKSPKALRPQLRPQKKSPSIHSSDSQQGFSPKQLQNRIYHCYVIPFTFVNGKLEILIAKKLCFNKKDGWIHNNAGQYVFLGGHCRNTSEKDVYDSSMKEFQEESGNQMQHKRNTVLKRWNDFSALFYVCFAFPTISVCFAIPFFPC